MGFDNVMKYNVALSLQDKIVELYGVKSRIYKPLKPIEMVGYESDIKFEVFETKCFIDFNFKRRVFYHFNWFPEDEDRVIPAFTFISSDVQCDYFIRTSVIDEVSPYGDLLFKVVKIFDEGKFKVLKRTLFVTPETDKSLYDMLNKFDVKR